MTWPSAAPTPRWISFYLSLLVPATVLEDALLSRRNLACAPDAGCLLSWNPTELTADIVAGTTMGCILAVIFLHVRRRRAAGHSNAQPHH